MKKLLLLMIMLSFGLHGHAQFQKKDNSLKNFVKKANQINERYLQRSINTTYQSLVNVSLRLPNTLQTLIEDDSYSYDGFGRDVLSEETSYDPFTGAVESKDKTEYYYDAQQGWLDYMLMYDYDTATSQYNLTEKYEILSYDTALRLPLEVVYATNNSGTWFNQGKDIYTYDNNGNVLTQISQTWNAGWVNSGKETFTYNPGGQAMQKDFYVWVSGTWQLSSTVIFSYDAQHRLIDKTTSQMQGASLINETKYTYSYNPPGQLLMREVQDWNGTQWEYIDRTIWSYDGDGNVLTEIDYDYAGSTWVENEKLDFTNYTNTFARADLLLPESFDEGDDDVDYFHHQINDVSSSEWDGSAWEVVMNIHLTYQPISVAGIDKITFADVNVYPNPATDNLYIDSDKELSISIYDLSGKQVFAGNLMPGKNIIDISQLQTGIYLATIYSNKHSATLKIVKQ